MAANESPAGARRRLRLALRRLRDERGTTQQQVADALVWSLSKVNRIEVGDVTVSVTDLHALLRLYGHEDEEERQSLVEAARVSRRRGWWDEQVLRANMTPEFGKYLQLESHARVIRTFQPAVIAGLFQTPAYIAAVFERFEEQLDPDALTERIAIRTRRQNEIFSRENPPSIRYLLDESVLLREVGGLRVLEEQLEHLLDRMDRYDVRVRLLPLAGAVFVARSGGYTLLSMEGDEDGVLFREDDDSDSLAETESTGKVVVGRYRERFEAGWAAALPEPESRRVIEARRADALVRLDRMK